MKPKQVSGVSKRLELSYAAGISQITKKILPPKKPDQTFDEWVAEIAARSEAEDVQRASDTLAKQMVYWANVGNKKSWREAAEKSQQSRKLFQLMTRELQGPVGFRVRQLRRENAKLITSVAADAARHLVTEITELQQKGARPETIDKMMRRRFPELLKSRTRLIARTETMKASAVLTQARAENVGCAAYEWLTSHDSRVRDSHRGMSGVIVLYNNPPAPEQLFPTLTKSGKPVHSTLGHYHAGEAPNDRCTQAPILDISDLSWPRKVYWQGSVKQMRKDEFAKLIGADKKAA
jgi:SPP1 gp7 family putative phage head morphogenesis protein